MRDKTKITKIKKKINSNKTQLMFGNQKPLVAPLIVVSALVLTNKALFDRRSCNSQRKRAQELISNARQYHTMAFNSTNLLESFKLLTKARTLVLTAMKYSDITSLNVGCQIDVADFLDFLTNEMQIAEAELLHSAPSLKSQSLFA